MANNDYITTDCKLTVSKNTAKLDEEIFLYKNDRNIKLLIEIVDNKYRYKSDDLSNLLVKYKASYAQVKWYKNAEVKKEFPIQATDDGKVVFVIEGELINEDTELGDYDLQLRLLNESQESIRSLPIIKGAVHILKPLFEEGDIATVNSAVADVSMLSLDGDAIDTYNSDGTYNQTNWGNGDVISSAKLNKLEKVAKDNVDKVNKMPAKSIVEGGKIYLAKEDGTKLDSGTELPAGGTGTSYDDTEIKTDINTIKTDLGTAQLTTTAKDVKGAVNEVAAQYKDIVHISDLAQNGNNVYIKDINGNKIGNGITIQTSTSATTDSAEYKFYNRGEVFEQPAAYTGWAKNLKYDRLRDKFVCIINCDKTHTDTSTDPPFICFIDPYSGSVYDLKKIKPKNSDGSDFSFGGATYVGSFFVDTNGDYVFINMYQEMFKSTDGGENFIYIKKCTINGGYSRNNSIFGLTKLSNGRLIGGNTGAQRHIYYSDDDGSSWTTVSVGGIGSSFEPCIIEHPSKDGRIMAISRKTMGANNYKDSEPAMLSFSTDYGTTWSNYVESTTLTNMTANNASATIFDNTLFMVYGTRVGTEIAIHDECGNSYNGAIFYTYASADDAWNDNFKTPKVIAYAKTTNQPNFGYPSIAMDRNGMMMCMYYDDTTIGQSGVNYYNIIGNQYPILSSIDSNPSMTSTYSSYIINKLLSSLKTELMTKINNIIIKNNGSVDDSTDGSYYITSNLIDSWDTTAGNESSWDTTACSLGGIKGNKLYACNIANTNQTSSITFDANNLLFSSVGLKDTLSALGITNELTIEVIFSTEDNADGCPNIVASTGSTTTTYLNIPQGGNGSIISTSGTSDVIPSWNTILKSNYKLSNSISHIIITITNASVEYYLNGQYKGKSEASVDLTTLTSGYLKVRGFKVKTGVLRLYNKILSVEEVLNNYKYEKTRLGL